MDATIIRAALSDLEGQLDLARRVMNQIEGTDRNGDGSYEFPEEVLEYNLEQLYDKLLIVLEATGLLETRNRFKEKWEKLEKHGGIGKTTYLQQYDALES